jgi:hypothetical protein
MDKLSLIERPPQDIKYGDGSAFIPEPMKIIWKNKEEMKKMWPAIEEWGDSMKPPVGTKSRRIEGRKKSGELFNQALDILGKKSAEELTKEDNDNIKNLSRIDYKLRGWEVGNSLPEVKKALLQHVALNQATQIVGVSNLKELNEEHLPKIKALNEEDWTKRGWKVPEIGVEGVKKRLKEAIKEPAITQPPLSQEEIIIQQKIEKTVEYLDKLPEKNKEVLQDRDDLVTAYLTGLYKDEKTRNLVDKYKNSVA